MVTPSGTYAAYALNDDVCNKSSSGGLAYTFGKSVIAEGGTVYGSVFEYGPYFSVHHIRCEDDYALSRTQGSKYVQSEVERNVYRQIRSDLAAGRKVLFVGTGCEVAGVRNFLRKDYPNFYAIDIICHGVPSIQILKDYLSLNYDIKRIKDLFFRGKNGFDLFGIFGAYSCNEAIYKPLKNNLYMMGFMKALYYRDACYTCPYARNERCGDITLGDFWGLKKSISTADRKSSGTSVLMLNSTKGRKLLKDISGMLRIEERPFEEALAGNPQLRTPSKLHYASRLFKFLYPIFGFSVAARLCLVREKMFYAYVLPLIQKLNK